MKYYNIFLPGRAHSHPSPSPRPAAPPSPWAAPPAALLPRLPPVHHHPPPRGRGRRSLSLCPRRPLRPFRHLRGPLHPGGAVRVP